MHESSHFNYLQYLDAEEERFVTYKRVREYKFHAIIPVEGTTREKNYFEAEYEYKKDTRKYYCATFSLHPEETKIVMSLSWYGDFIISQNEFKKICNNKNFCFTKEQDEYYEGLYELRKKQKEIEERMKMLEKDFE